MPRQHLLDRRASVLISMVLIAGACSGAGATSTPPTPPTTTAALETSAPVTPARSAAGPSVAVTACPFEPIGYPGGGDALKAPSDRLVDVQATAGSTVDTLTFVFELKGPSSPSDARPRLRVQEVTPPFAYAGSGKSFDVMGDRHMAVVFDGMTIADPDGSAVFTGSPLELGKFTGLRDAVQFDDFEGVLGWIVGVSDPVCIAVDASAANEVVLSIAHD